MIGRIFGVLVLLSVAFGAGNGRFAAVAQASVEGAERAVELSIALLGMMCLWSGVMRVLEAMGASRILTKWLSPLMRLLFPDAVKKGRGTEQITAAFSANLLGVGNAATPLAVEAMQALAENNRHLSTASDDMVTFTALGCACPTLFPTTLIALRTAAGSADPFGILLPVWICSLVCSGMAVMLARLMRHLFPHRKEGADG